MLHLACDAVDVRLVRLSKDLPGKHRRMMSVSDVDFPLETNLAKDPLVSRSIDRDASDWEWIR